MIDFKNFTLLPLLEFVDLLARESFAEAVAQFDDTMKSASPPDKLESLWKALNAQVGKFKKRVGIRREQAAQYEIVYVTC